MHLLMETAITDSKDYEILSYEEIEKLKKERAILQNQVDATRRKLALESKLRDAAQSLNRLYSTRGRTDAPSPEAGKKRRSLLGGRASQDASSRADDEFAASNRKVEEYRHELAGLERRLEEVQKRLLEHTAGILQMTHRGLKKNVRRTELPRSPESMASQGTRRVSGLETLDDFDERSLYQVPDYVTEFGHIPTSLTTTQKSKSENELIGKMGDRLNQLSQRLHSMITQAEPHEKFDPPPQTMPNGNSSLTANDLETQLGYVSQGLDVMEAVQARTAADAQKTLFDSEDQLEDVNVRLHEILERTNSVSQSPILAQDQPRGKDMQSQLAFSTQALDRLTQRVETLVEQKDILTRQIQQQRELNSKSDAQRDAQIHELTRDLEETKQKHQQGEEDAQQTRGQMNLLMEQLDQAKQQHLLNEQQRSTADSSALQVEKQARKESEKKLLDDLKVHQEQLATFTAAKEENAKELAAARTEIERLESEVVRVQTEMTMVKAELDGAYGTRAQRAADVSMNPAIQKEIDELNSRNLDLQRELKETIEDYEIMTKQSIDSEKERDHLEEKVDTLEQRCEGLEAQLNEEKVKWLGARSGAAGETTSTMVLKNEFKKMMRDTRAENMKSLKVSLGEIDAKPKTDSYNQAEQEERRRLEGIIRNMKKEMLQQTPSKANNS